MTHRPLLHTLMALIVSLTTSSCSRIFNEAPPEAAQMIPRQTGFTSVNPPRLRGLTAVLESLGLFPGLYQISHFKASPASKNRNQIFEEWLSHRLTTVDRRMHEEMLEWKLIDAKYSRQEECGTLRNRLAIRDTAENFTFSKDLHPDDVARIAKALTELQATGIEFGYNGFDLSGCNTSPRSRQMDDYVISPLLIDPLSGDLFEFHYIGGCR